MFSNTGFVGYNYRWFIGQVPPKKNQYQGKVKWKDAWGDRVKVRIPGVHPQDNRIKDDDLPWAIVAKPTSQGNFNGGTSGIMGGEWVIGFFLDESNQIPIITHVLGVNLVGNGADAKKLAALGSTFFQHISRFDGTGLQAGNSETTGGPKPTSSAAKDITKEEADGASLKAGTATTKSGIPSKPTITTNNKGQTVVTVTERFMGDVEKSSIVFASPPSQSELASLDRRQAAAYQSEYNRENYVMG